MPTLNAVHSSLDDIPEQYQDLYTEKNGQYELTGISGVKTTADIDRLQTSLNKEREEHKATKAKLSNWGDLEHDDVMSKLDRIPELEAAASGKIDEEKIEEMVTKRVEGTLKTRLGPVERNLEKTTKELEELRTERDNLISESRTRTIHDDVRAALVKTKVIPEAQEDALMLADKVFQIDDQGKVVTKDGVGITPGIPAADWLQELSDKKPHWWAASQGGGARGGSGSGGGMSGNPWSKANWNLTEQGKVVKEKGTARAEQMAKAAGSHIGATKPAEA
jgi:hypothetical protein